MTLSHATLAYSAALTLSLSKGAATLTAPAQGFDKLSLSAVSGSAEMNVNEARNG
jgi:hypothetical protein